MDPVSPIAVADDYSMRYDITYKNWKCEEIKEGSLSADPLPLSEREYDRRNWMLGPSAFGISYRA